MILTRRMCRHMTWESLTIRFFFRGGAAICVLLANDMRLCDIFGRLWAKPYKRSRFSSLQHKNKWDELSTLSCGMLLMEWQKAVRPLAESLHLESCGLMSCALRAGEMGQRVTRGQNRSSICFLSSDVFSWEFMSCALGAGEMGQRVILYCILLYSFLLSSLYSILLCPAWFYSVLF